MLEETVPEQTLSHAATEWSEQDFLAERSNVQLLRDIQCVENIFTHNSVWSHSYVVAGVCD